MNVPQLRFSGFEDTWSKKKIKEIALVTSGLTPLRSRNEFFRNGSIPWVKTMDLNNSIIKDTQEYVTEVAMKETSLRLLPANTLLIAMYGGFNQIGRTGIISFTGTTNQAISALTPKENSFSPFFLQSYLNFNVEKWKRLAASSRKDPNITKSDIENFFVRLPSIAEQEKLASFFKLIEQRIEKQQEKIEKLVQFKKGMMQKIFSQELRFKGEDGGEFGEWEQQKLNTLAESLIGLTYSPDNVVNSEDAILVLRSSNIKNSVLKFDDNVYVNMKIPEKLFVEKGDILLCSRNGSRGLIGKSALINTDMVNTTFGAFMTLIRSNEGLFVYQLFQTEEFYKQIHENLGATINQITTKNLNQFEFMMPTSREEREKIGKVLLIFDEKIKKENEKLLVLEEQKKGFIQGMFV